MKSEIRVTIPKLAGPIYPAGISAPDLGIDAQTERNLSHKDTHALVLNALGLLIPPLLSASISRICKMAATVPVVPTTDSESPLQDAPTKKAKPGAAWKSNETHVLPKNRLPIVVTVIFPRSMDPQPHL